jgi:hypothetical protein
MIYTRTSCNGPNLAEAFANIPCCSHQLSQLVQFKLLALFVVAFGGRFQVDAGARVAIEVPGPIGGQAVSDLNVAEALAIVPLGLVFTPDFGRYVRRHHAALLISKYPRLGQEETRRVGLPGGCHVTKGIDARVMCLQGIDLYGDPTRFVR